MSAAQPFNPRLVFGLIAAGIAAFAALLLLLAYGGPLAPRSGRADPMSVGATGFRALSLLVENFREVHLDETSDEWADHLLIVTLDPRNSPADVRRLLERRRANPTLVILPKWATLPDPRRRGWVRALGPGLGTVAEPLLGEGFDVSLFAGSPPQRVAGSGLLAGLDIPVPPSPQQVRGPDLLALAALPGGGALVAQIGDRPHFILADPDLLNNHGLSDPARARTALTMVELMNEGGYAVDFDLSMAGAGSGGSEAPSLLRLAFEPPFLAMTLALVIAGLLAGFYGAFRFGPVRREERAIAFGKAALVENSAGLIRLAGREARLGAAYADVVRHDMARVTGAPYWLQGEKLDAYLDRLARGGARFTALAEELDRAGDRHDLMAAARSLHQWKKDIIP